MKNHNFHTKKNFWVQIFEKFEKAPPQKFFFPNVFKHQKKEITSRFDTPNFGHNKTAGFKNPVGQNPPPPQTW